MCQHRGGDSPSGLMLVHVPCPPPPCADEAIPTFSFFLAAYMNARRRTLHYILLAIHLRSFWDLLVPPTREAEFRTSNVKGARCPTETKKKNKKTGK